MIDPKTYAATPDLLRGKVILITGAGSGLGKALALGSARAGATVILCGRQKSKLERVYDEIESGGGPQPALAPIDFGSATAVEYDQLASVIEREFGRLDGLVHCAAILGDRTPIDQYDVPTWCKVLHVDLTAPFILTQVLLPNLRRSADASVIFVSSSVARRPKAYWGAYCVAKAGIEALGAMLAIEVESQANLRVNTVNPGAIRTPMRAAAYPAEKPSSVLAPDAVAGVFLYLLGADSRGVSGRHFDAQ
jgi:NAD(P)-dependent dehydrogenase (short-subunit alcohol dehydrogenase family)